MLNRFSTLKELFSYLWKRKYWWLIPALVVFFVFGFIVLIIGSSPLAPIVYPLF